MVSKHNEEYARFVESRKIELYFIQSASSQVGLYSRCLSCLTTVYT